jgi:Reticulon
VLKNSNKYSVHLNTAADLILWRNKKLSASVLGGATVIWILFEVLEYCLLTFTAHCLIMSLAGLFIYSKALTFIQKSVLFFSFQYSLVYGLLLIHIGMKFLYPSLLIYCSYINWISSQPKYAGCDNILLFRIRICII